MGPFLRRVGRSSLLALGEYTETGKYAELRSIPLREVAELEAIAGVSTRPAAAADLLEWSRRDGGTGEGPAPPFPPPAGEHGRPLEFLRRLAAGGRRLFERAAPIWPVAREAAASDPLIAEWWSDEMERRFETARGYVERLPAGALRKDLTPKLAADIFWTVASPETYEALVVRRGWSPEAFETWIAEAIADLLLD